MRLTEVLLKINEVLRSHKDTIKGYESLGSTKVLSKKMKLPDGRTAEYTIAMGTSPSTRYPSKDNKVYLVNLSYPFGDAPVNISRHAHTDWNQTGYDAYRFSQVVRKDIDKDVLKMVIPALHKRVLQLHPPGEAILELSKEEANHKVYKFSDEFRDLIIKVFAAHAVVSKHLAGKLNDRQAKLNCLDALDEADLEDYADL